MEHSFFKSNTIQYSIINGKKSGQEKHVEIKNGKGTKKIKKIENGNVVSNVSVPLSSEELEKAQKNIFMPTFWKNCNPGNAACTIHNASKRKTKKQRRY